MKIILTSILVLFFLNLTACGYLIEKKQEISETSVNNLFNEAKLALEKGRYDESIKLFETLESRFPFGSYTQQAQMQIAYIYYKQNDVAQCIAAIDRFIRIHPNHPNLDYMFYLKGLANFSEKKGLFDFISRQDPTERDPNATKEAYNTFNELIEKFPESIYVEDSKYRLDYLLSSMAKYEIHVANFYLNKGAYVAAVNRAKIVIKDYPNTSSVKNALKILIKGYDLLGLKKLSNDSKRVYELNFDTTSNKVRNDNKKSWWKFW